MTTGHALAQIEKLVAAFIKVGRELRTIHKIKDARGKKGACK
jgi:hypothetical protein